MDGTVPKPNEIDKKAIMWRRWNNLVMGWVLCNMELEISKLFYKSKVSFYTLEHFEGQVWLDYNAKTKLAFCT